MVTPIAKTLHHLAPYHVKNKNVIKLFLSVMRVFIVFMSVMYVTFIVVFSLAILLLSF